MPFIQIPADQMLAKYQELLTRLYHEPRGDKQVDERSVIVCSNEADKAEEDQGPDTRCMVVTYKQSDPTILEIYNSMGVSPCKYLPKKYIPVVCLLDPTLYPELLPSFEVRSLIYVDKDFESFDYTI